MRFGGVCLDNLAPDCGEVLRSADWDASAQVEQRLVEHLQHDSIALLDESDSVAFPNAELPLDSLRKRSQRCARCSVATLKMVKFVYRCQ